MAPTPRQVELFHKLTTDRDFSGTDVDMLRSQFSTLTVASASQWIDRAMTLPKTGDTGQDGQDLPPTF